MPNPLRRFSERRKSKRLSRNVDDARQQKLAEVNDRSASDSKVNQSTKPTAETETNLSSREISQYKEEDAQAKTNTSGSNKYQPYELVTTSNGAGTSQEQPQTNGYTTPSDQSSKDATSPPRKGSKLSQYIAIKPGLGSDAQAVQSNGSTEEARPTTDNETGKSVDDAVDEFSFAPSAASDKHSASNVSVATETTPIQQKSKQLVSGNGESHEQQKKQASDPSEAEAQQQPNEQYSDAVAAAVKDTAEQSRVTAPNEQTRGLEGTATIRESLQRTAMLTKVKQNYNPVGDIEPPPKQQEETKVHPATREDVENAFEQYANLIHAANRPMPGQAGDAYHHKKNEPTGLMADLRNIGFKDLNTVRRILEQKASGEPQDDRKYLMEAVMQLTAALPERSKNRVELTSKFLDELWYSMEHPPQSYLGDDFRYRAADGSRNNYTLPRLGAANTPYARSVNPLTVTPAARPDPFLIFDSIMARQEFKENPNRVSSLFFNWASVVIHDLFQTDHKDPSISKTSSYLDLSVLYGDCQEDQNMMRTFKDGKIKPDCFAEQRLLAFPPTAGVLIILLNRYHNYVVSQLATINEHGRFTRPSDKLSAERKAAAWKKYDEDLFQTGRLVTCGLYINIILYDYLRTIVNLNRTNSTWTLDPRMEKPTSSPQEKTPSGLGNQVSAEFSLSYAWHSGVGQLDEAWTREVYQELLGKEPDEADIKDLMLSLAKYDHELSDDPHERPFANLERLPDGKYKDDDLATILINATEQVSGAFGALNTPKCLRSIVALGINRARSWNLCTLNEFRAFWGLKKFDTFEEINSDPYVAEQLKNLYEHPDYVEFYPGIAIEEAKEPMVPGVGICPNHTIARAVLSDAVALVRGDRFYTIDYSPKNLTNWGYNEVDYDLNVNQGCVIYKLFLNALPNHFKPDSIYAHYPMTVPDENAKIMKNLGRFHDYNWERPSYTRPQVNLKETASANVVLKKASQFAVPWSEGLKHVMGSSGEKFCLAGDNVLHKKQHETMQGLLYREKWHEHIKKFYQHITHHLIAEKNVKIARVRQVDIVRDVSNLAHVHFATDLFGLPLKGERRPRGIFTDYELWMALSVMYTAIFQDTDPSKSYPLRQVSRKLASMIGSLVELNVLMVVPTSYASKVFNTNRDNEDSLENFGVRIIRQLCQGGMSPHDVVYSQILPTVVHMVPQMSQSFAQILDFYLGEGKEHWSEIQKLATLDSAETDQELLGYVLEGIRLNGTSGVYRRAESAQTFKEADEEISINRGDRIYCSFIKAARDATIYPDPNAVRVDRPRESYIHYGIDQHKCLGQEASLVALTAMLRAVASLPGLRRAPGEQGDLKTVQTADGSYTYMSERHDSYSPFPTTMKVHFDTDAVDVPKRPTSTESPKTLLDYKLPRTMGDLYILQETDYSDSGSTMRSNSSYTVTSSKESTTKELPIAKAIVEPTIPKTIHEPDVSKVRRVSKASSVNSQADSFLLRTMGDLDAFDTASGSNTPQKIPSPATQQNRVEPKISVAAVKSRMPGSFDDDSNTQQDSQSHKLESRNGSDIASKRSPVSRKAKLQGAYAGNGVYNPQLMWQQGVIG